jgi:hypothetical protein
MEIYTVEDAGFPSLQVLLRKSLIVGEYHKEGVTRRVSLSRNVLLVSLPEDPHKIGVSYARSDAEAEHIASRLLDRAAQRGHAIKLEPGYENLLSTKDSKNLARALG